MRQNSSKINQLIKIWPQKTIAGKEWLSQMGFERQLVAAYEKITWLNRIGRGIPYS